MVGFRRPSDLDNDLRVMTAARPGAVDEMIATYERVEVGYRRAVVFEEAIHEATNTSQLPASEIRTATSVW